MHASLVSILLLFSRHVPAAPSNVGLGELPGQQARGGTLHMHHMDAYDRKIRKRFDDGSWAPGKYPPFPPVEAPKDGAQSTEPPTPAATDKASQPTDPAKEKPAADDKKHEPRNECRSLSENKYLFTEPLTEVTQTFFDDADKEFYDSKSENKDYMDVIYGLGSVNEVKIGPSCSLRSYSLVSTL